MKTSEADLKRRNVTEASMIENLDQMFSNIRHELGNSVNSLKITLEVLLRNYDHFDDQKRIDFLERACEQVNRQHRFLDAMKRYSRTSISNLEPVFFIPFWNQYIGSLKLTMLEKNILFRQSVTDRPYKIMADKKALTKLFDNLFENAVDALEDREKPMIEVTVVGKDGILSISIRDNGCGIEPHIYDRIFMPLFTTREGKTGLGLSIVRKIAAGIDGQIRITSEHGKGTMAELSIKLVNSI